MYSDEAKTIFRSAAADSFYICESLLHWELQNSKNCSYSGVIDGFQIGKSYWWVPNR